MLRVYLTIQTKREWGSMNNNELFNQNLKQDEGVCLQDYTPEQLEEMFEERKKAQCKQSNQMQKKKKTKQTLEKFKNNYFAYYDDIKIPSHKVQDW